MITFTAIGLPLRWLVALFGVFATYNPSGYSYYHWILRGEGLPSLRVLVGVVLAIFYVVYVRATVRSLGPIGTSLATAFFGSIVWLLAEWRFVDLGEPDQRWVASLSISASVLAVGMSWSAIRYRISGQYDSEDVGAAL